MGGTERQQLQFLRFGRPGAAATALVAFGIYDLVAPSGRLHVLLVLLVGALVFSLLGALALRSLPIGTVARTTLVADIALIAAMIGVLDEPSVLVVPYYAPIAFAALMFGPVETLAYTALGALAGVVVGLAIGVDSLTVVADVVVLAITGAILAALSREMRRAERALARDRAIDAAVLQIAERLRALLDPEEVLTSAVEELGRACEAARGLLRRTAPDERIYQWARDGVERMEFEGVTPTVARVVQSGEPLVIRTRADAVDDPELLAHLERFGVQSLIAYPVVMQGEVIAVVGVHDDSVRPWTGGAEEVVARALPHVAAALAQAEAFERQRATVERLEELSRLREELIANVSHELRTPLTSTLGFLRTLERTDIEISPEQRADFLRTARAEAERLAVLVEDLLLLTRLERDAVPLTLTPVDVRAVVERAGTSLQPPEDRRVRIEIDERLTVVADEQRLLQVVMNLLENALRHGAGEIVVEASAEDEWLLLTVSDEGPGIEAEHIPHLFTPFSRWSERSDSSGLGLAIARGLVNAHGGTLEYITAAAGRPHAFTVALPR